MTFEIGEKNIKKKKKTKKQNLNDQWELAGKMSSSSEYCGQRYWGGEVLGAQQSTQVRSRVERQGEVKVCLKSFDLKLLSEE